MQIPRNRTDLERETLPNGFEILSYVDPSERAYGVSVAVPIGSRDFGGNVRPGTPHFLEHMLCEDCTPFPGIHGWRLKMAEVGGQYNALTYSTHSTYYHCIPAVTANDKLLIAPLRIVFEDAMTERALERNRSIIKDERRGTSPHFPGSSDWSAATYRRWLSAGVLEEEQTLGSDADLDALTIEELQAVHRTYFQKGAKLIYIGPAPLPEAVRSYVANLVLNAPTPPRAQVGIHWVKCHAEPFAGTDTNRVRLHWGWSGLCGTKEEYAQLLFLGSWLENSPFKSLFTWLRDERGSAYGIEREAYDVDGMWRHELILPASDVAAAQELANELPAKIREILLDDEACSNELTRQAASSTWWTETLSHSLLTATDEAMTDSIVNLSEWFAALEPLRDPAARMAWFERAFSADVSGTFITYPAAS